MNGYDAQDMASQGADGFRNGYQAGYADAVNAIEAAQPAAAQEAVAWQVGDEFYPSESLAIEAIQQWGPSDAIAIPLYAAASVTAAPVEVIRDDDGEIVMVKQGGKIIASTCHAGGKSPAAPGIDLTTLIPAEREQPELMLATWHEVAGWNMCVAEIRRRIDASPKSDSCATCNGHGMVGGLLPAGGGYESEPCPHCHGTAGHWEGCPAPDDASPKGGREADDAALLNWMDANGFTAYRSVDPIDGISGHCVVVHETMAPRRGNVHDTIRGAIRAAMKAQASDAEVQP